MKFDLQIHSTASDGEMRPTEIVRTLARKNYVAMALCDHDTVKGLPEAIRAGKKFGLIVVPGIEMSSEFQKRNLHLLGLGIDHRYLPLRRRCARYQKARIERAQKVVAKLKQLGLTISYRDVDKSAAGTVTRAHISAELLKHRANRPRLKKYCQTDLTVSNVIKALIMPGKPAYVGYRKIPIARDIELIHRAGGVAILSHPGLLDIDFPDLDTVKLITALKKLGLDGLEIYSGSYSLKLANKYRRLAEKMDLLPSAGSDFHGHFHRQRLGTFQAPRWVWEKLSGQLRSLAVIKPLAKD